jgi:glycerol-3-phosphate dehydrogenase
MHIRFSGLERAQYLKDMAEREFDLLVIGGGITGAGIALDAQVRGLNTALVEMQDFAAGTSSRSTKLVHGGLRYLKQLDIQLVAEVGRERAIVYENAPHVTTPEWMLLPIIEGGTYGLWATSIGLKIYDLLAGVKEGERRRMLNRAQTLEKEPLLRKDRLKGSGYYVEYRTDDARLTIEVLKAAVSRGVQAVNYTKVERFLYEEGRIAGVQVVDQLSGETYPLRAKKIVNAAGPWVDTLREIDGSRKGKRLHLTKGVHLVVDNKRFPLKQAVYFDTPDGRMVFAIPRDGKTYIGTTDTDYQGDYGHPRVTEEDRDYLLRAVHFMFPEVRLRPEDVESSWAGLRPLIHEDGKSPSELSRKDEIFLSESGLISIAGGKLTGYRKMAERVVDLVCRQLSRELNRAFPVCTTDRIRLSGGDVGGSAGWEAFVQEKVREGIALGLPGEVAERLVRRYGSNIVELYGILKRQGEQADAFGLDAETFVSLVYGIEQEMVATPADYFIRRTGALYFDIEWVKKQKEGVIRYMAARFRWSEKEKLRHEETLERQLHDAAVPIGEAVPADF